MTDFKGLLLKCQYTIVINEMSWQVKWDLVSFHVESGFMRQLNC